MPDRIVRADLERSEGYWQLPDDTLRLLFRHLLNRADDYGNAEAGPVALATTMNRPVTADLAAKWRQELSTVDLARPYQVGVKWYVHIPRFRQRMRALHPKHPRPPHDIECKEMKDLIERSAGHATYLRPANDRHKPDARLASALEVKGIEGNRREVKGSEATASAEAARAKPAPTTPTTPKPVGEIIQTQNGTSADPWWKSEKGIMLKAVALNMPAHPGETYQAWATRLLDADKQAKRPKA